MVTMVVLLNKLNTVYLEHALLSSLEKDVLGLQLRYGTLRVVEVILLLTGRIPRSGFDPATVYYLLLLSYLTKIK
jgi:hypothetical protein